MKYRTSLQGIPLALVTAFHFKMAAARRAGALHSGYQHTVTRQWQNTDTTITPFNLIYPLFIS